LLLCLLGLVFFHLNIKAQCTSNVPFFTLNLTGNADSTWISQNVVRSGDCCGSTFPDRCISFSILLDPAAVGIIFDIYSGAVPPGALYYQVNCGNITQVGEAICLSGPGPHFLTFCKPGNNINEYVIRSVRGPAASDGVDLYYQCSGIIYASGFIDSTLAWNSISPGGYGSFNSYLSCNAACDTIRMDYNNMLPPTILYQVCGTPIAVCGLNTVCDTVRVRYFPNLYTIIQPQDPLLCYGVNSVQLTANVNNGVAPFTYLWNTGETTPSIIAGAGTYHVRVIDAQSCGFAVDTVVVSQVAEPVAAFLPADFDTCNTVSTIRLTGRVTGAPSMVWTGGTTSFLPANNAPTVTYSFTSADRANGYVDIILHAVQTTTNCPFKDDTLRVTLTTFTATPLATVNNVTCYGNNNGSVQVLMNQGNPPFLYRWNTGWGLPLIQNLPQGQYTLTVTDANMCTATYNYNISQPPPMAINAVVNNALCFGSNTGSVNVTVTGGLLPYTYLWSNGATTQNIGNLGVGNYSVTAFDANQCSVTGIYSISQPTPITVTLNTINPPSCYAGTNGSILITATGATPPYTYQWSNGSTTQNAGNLQAGSYTVTVYDQYQCSATASYIVSQPPQLVLNTAVLQPITCYNGSNGSITANPSGGTFPYYYIWSNGATTSGVNNLIAGSYSVTVRDNNQCTVSGSYLLLQPSQMLMNPPVIRDAGCYNGNDGSITINPSGGALPYLYQWSNGNTTNAATNLYAGIYGVTVYDANYCSITASYAVSQPQSIILSQPAIQNVNCYGGTNGSITGITATNGIAPYFYVWNTGASTQDIVGIPAGNYTLTVYDQGLCSVTAAYTVQQPAPTQLNAIVQHVTCFNENNGRIILSPSGGAPPYTYLWNNGATTQTLFNLSPGTYSVTVYDRISCFTLADFLITQPALLAADSAILTTPRCFNDNNGSITVSPYGGASPYTYQWSNGSSLQAIGNLYSGNYQVTVVDNNFCTVTAVFNLTQPAQININPTAVSDASCYGAANGYVTIGTTGGVLPYRYSWSNGATTQNVANLTAGNYTVTVADNNQCTVAATFYIYQPAEILINISAIVNVKCFGGNDGRISVIALGNFPPFSYLWNNGDSSASVSNLTAGTYSVTVTDSNQCSSISLYTVTQPGQMDVNATVTPEHCYDANNGSIASNTTGGTPGYIINLLQNGNFIQSSATGNFTYLAPDTYELVAIDANGCADTAIAVVLPATPDLYQIDVDSISCKGEHDGMITVTTLSTQNGPYTFRMNDTLENYSGIFSYLGPGIYEVTATNAYGCDTVLTANIIDPVPAYVSIVPDSSFIELGEQIQFDVIFGPYQPSSIISYDWQPRSGLSCYDCPAPYPLNFGLINRYELTVTYNEGCLAKAKAVVIVNPVHKVFIPNIFSPNGDGRNDLFEIYGNKKGWKEMEFYIFDRWGELVFKTTDKYFTWDGTFQGKELNPAVFVFYSKVIFLDGFYEKHQGSITLAR
jgi:gliding motility-associated-like protein